MNRQKLNQSLEEAFRIWKNKSPEELREAIRKNAAEIKKLVRELPPEKLLEVQKEREELRRWIDEIDALYEFPPTSETELRMLGLAPEEDEP
jgi:predicted ABC-class ATPase